MLRPSEDVELGGQDVNIRVHGETDQQERRSVDHEVDDELIADEEDELESESDSNDSHQALLPLHTPGPTLVNGHAPVVADVPAEVIEVHAEHRKTVLALIYALFSFVSTCASLALVHERRPEGEPLPDSVLDRVSRRNDHRITVLYASEILITLQTLSAVLLVSLHAHRLIVLRRVALIVGTLYLYRAITMWLTVLPSSDPTYECAPKLPQGQNMTFTLLSSRVFTIITGFGLSINGHHIYCGDSIYSGHTMIILIGHLVITEYCPRRCSWMSWVTCFNAMAAVLLLMLSRGHYSIDVVIAYFVTTRTWCFYHLLAHHASLRETSSSNSLRYLWWFRPLLYMEKGVPVGKLPNRLALPPSLARLRLCRRMLAKLGTRGRNRRRKSKRMKTMGPQTTIADMARNLLTQHEQ